MAFFQKLTRLEARLQGLIEGSLARLFAGQTGQADLARLVLEQMRAGVRDDGQGRQIAPNLFTIMLASNQAAHLQEHPELLQDLTQAIRAAGQEAGFSFFSPPAVKLEASDQVAPGQVKITARHSQDALSQTSDVVVSLPDELIEIPADAFLIVDGTQIFPLHHPVINIGRRSDNHLVIDDVRISRLHAQLRAIRGRYVIFDLNSLGGTEVNGKPIQQSPLYPGDVIALSGVPLIFGQDPTARPESPPPATDTHPLSPLDQQEPQP